MILQQSDAVLSGKCELPSRLYRVRCLLAKFVEKNSKGNPMTSLKMEVIGPDEIKNAAGQPIRPGGASFDIYIVHTAERIQETFDLLNKLGVPHGGQYDGTKVNDYFRGLEWDMPLSSEETFMTYPKTDNQKEPEYMLDSAGQKIPTGWRVSAWANTVPLNAAPSRVDLGPF